MLLVEAMHSPDSGRVVHHARSLESFCAQNGIKLSSGSGVSVVSRAVPATSFPTPFTSPLFTGSFPSSPLLYSPDIGQQRIGRIDLVPPFSLDGLQPANTSSPPASPLGPRQLSLPARLLNDRLQNSPQVGIVHLALQNDSSGSILRSLSISSSCFCSWNILSILLLGSVSSVGRMMYLLLLNPENLQTSFCKV